MPPIAVDGSTSDLDKIKEALSSLTSISSVDDVLSAFGLADLPPAQRYGILFGCITFTLTVTVVLILLALGGSFQRIAEQSQTGETITVPDAISARKRRALLLEKLLEARQWMLETNYPERLAPKKRSGGFTSLTKMLVNIAPKEEKVLANVSDLLDEEDKKGRKKKSRTESKEMDPQVEKKKEEIRRLIPEGYEQNFVEAYRKCQDKPGGSILSGRPEARFEAYARAYAGCGLHTTPAYRRSYARMYEAVACKTHDTDDKFRELFLSRPQDLIGRTVRLEPLEELRHLQVIFDLTCGETYQENKAYDPNEVWGFLDCGPFRTPDELRDSFVFQRESSEAAFAILENVTDRVVGLVMLTNDDPKNLNISIELPIVKPTSDGTVEQIEACFLLLDRLFALGYRRVQLSIDAQDVRGKRLPGRLGFTQEGLIPKHMIVKEANRDSCIYGMLNSDWDKGARSFLFKKLHGAKAQRIDEDNNAKEGEVDEQMRVLKERKAAQDDAKKNKKI